MEWLDRSAIGWEQTATRPMGPEPIPAPPSEHGTPIDNDEKEITKERTVSKTKERADHGSQEYMIDTKSIQAGGTCLESSGTKEKYTTRITDQTFDWKDV